MTRMKTMAKKLRHLGRPSRLPASPQAAVLDRVANPHPDTDYVARLTAPEFTTLCPITGQPDFAHLVIDYAPEKWLLESQSFKLYLGSFRNFGAFHEACTLAIGTKLVASLKPNFLRIPAAAYRSTSSVKRANYPRTCGCRIRGWPPSARGDEPRQRSQAEPSPPGRDRPCA